MTPSTVHRAGDRGLAVQAYRASENTRLGASGASENTAFLGASEVSGCVSRPPLTKCADWGRGAEVPVFEGGSESGR